LLNFNDAPGAQPRGTLLQAADGDLYGTTSKRGTVYRITPNGTLTTLYLFCSHADCVDGDYPTAGLVQVTNGDFYGTTMFGGAQSTPATASGPGTIFKITPGGTFTTLYSFCSQAECADGYYPGTRLVQAADGDLYGTTQAGFYIRRIAWNIARRNSLRQATGTSTEQRMARMARSSKSPRLAR
jgi:uncharacterized repeat protein (TIGR03803 family)